MSSPSSSLTREGRLITSASPIARLRSATCLEPFPPYVSLAAFRTRLQETRKHATSCGERCQSQSGGPGGSTRPIRGLSSKFLSRTDLPEPREGLHRAPQRSPLSNCTEPGYGQGEHNHIGGKLNSNSSDLKQAKSGLSSPYNNLFLALFPPRNLVMPRLSLLFSSGQQRRNPA